MRTLLSLFVMACSLAAQPALVTITGPWNTALGNGWTGKILISNPRVICGGISIPANNVTATITAGTLTTVTDGIHASTTLRLYGLGACGAGYSYTVRYVGSTSATTYWLVQAAPTTTTVSAVESSTPTSATMSVSLSQLQVGISAGKCLGSSDGIQWTSFNCAPLAGEPALGNPAGNGYLLSSTTAGVRSWVAPPTAGVWGQITGTLGNQTDLSNALGLKEPSLGNPASDGYVLSSTALGSRSWVAQSVGTGTVTHAAGALSVGYFIVGNGGGDVAASSSLHTDESGVLTNTNGFASGGSGTGYVDLGGASSGKVRITAQSAAGTWTLTVPTTAGTSGQALITDGSGNTSWASRSDNKRGFGYSFNGGGSALSPGLTGYLTVPYACTISAWNVSADQGTATVDVWKVATGTAIPTVLNSITASALPALATGTSIHSTNLTGWSKAVSANDIVGINLNAVASATFVNITVECDQ